MFRCITCRYFDLKTHQCSYGKYLNCENHYEPADDNCLCPRCYNLHRPFHCYFIIFTCKKCKQRVVYYLIRSDNHPILVSECGHTKLILRETRYVCPICNNKVYYVAGNYICCECNIILRMLQDEREY